MRIPALLFVLGASVCVAQTGPLPGIIPALFPPQLKQYFAFSDDQVSKITNLKQQLATYQLTKLQRQSTIQLEIVQETAKETPNAVVLGTRYVELETIRRDLTNEQKRTVELVQALLSIDQKMKLSTLQQAMLLYPTACSAVDQNILSAPTAFPANRIPPSRWFDTSSFLIGVPQCGTTFPTAVIRSGDFSDVIPAP